jgi:hypothetical protein
LYDQCKDMCSSACEQIKALLTSEIKPLFNSIKTLIIVFEFAMYSLELEIKFKNKIKIISDLPTLFFFHNIMFTVSIFFVWPCQVGTKFVFFAIYWVAQKWCWAARTVNVHFPSTLYHHNNNKISYLHTLFFKRHTFLFDLTMFESPITLACPKRRQNGSSISDETKHLRSSVCHREQTLCGSESI